MTYNPVMVLDCGVGSNLAIIDEMVDHVMADRRWKSPKNYLKDKLDLILDRLICSVRNRRSSRSQTSDKNVRKK